MMNQVAAREGLSLAVDHALVGGSAIDNVGTPLPDETLDKALEWLITAGRKGRV